MTRYLIIILLSLLSLNGVAAVQPKGQYIQPNNLFPKVLFTTSLGNFTVE
jgi:hypothetical protein